MIDELSVDRRYRVIPHDQEAGEGFEGRFIGGIHASFESYALAELFLIFELDDGSWTHVRSGTAGFDPL